MFDGVMESKQQTTKSAVCCFLGPHGSWIKLPVDLKPTHTQRVGAEKGGAPETQQPERRPPVGDWPRAHADGFSSVPMRGALSDTADASVHPQKRLDARNWLHVGTPQNKYKGGATGGMYLLLVVSASRICFSP